MGSTADSVDLITDTVCSRPSRSGGWFLRSGIQEPSGGVARYYRADLERNQPVSTEITGYAVSTLVYLHSLTEEERYVEPACAAARFLTAAWDSQTQTMPFETDPAEFSYFFDCGIIIRGLLSAWRMTGTDEFLDVAAAVGKSMAADFASGDGYHPILSLPGKKPVARDAMRWSRSADCYQLKAAMAWWDLWHATGDAKFRDLYDGALQDALRTYGSFLPGHPDRVKVMDRLHPFLYFLEGLLPRASEKACAAALSSGIRTTAKLLRDIAPQFERCDVYAQLLRIRLYADWAGAVALDSAAARYEAGKLAGFQAADADRRIDGGFSFGRREGFCMPHISPVATAFALQALALWDASLAGQAQPHVHLLI